MDCEQIIRLGKLIIYPNRYLAFVSNKKISLTKNEFEILCCLTKKPGWVFTRPQLIDNLHGVGYAVTDRTIDFQMVGLRKKLGTERGLIETVRGVGYRFN